METGLSDLQQQKLLELTSRTSSLVKGILSTIVEIIRAYQPSSVKVGFTEIYNSRNYQSLLAITVYRFYDQDLQQQKLLELTSLKVMDMASKLIYNSRNYQSLLARTVVGENHLYLQQQKLLELTSRTRRVMGGRDLQQQKLLELTSPQTQRQRLRTSTIVEIIRAYQPQNIRSKMIKIYNSRNYQSLLANNNEYCYHNFIYNSRNYQSLLARKRIKKKFANLQQQKLLELTSRPLPQKQRVHIYNSRNYQSLLAPEPFPFQFCDLQQQKLLELTSPLSIAKIQKIL